MSELYRKMMREHPVQKEWKPKEGDRYVWIEDPWNEPFRFIGSGSELLLADKLEDRERFWILRQEQWQEIYQRHTNKNQIEILQDFITEFGVLSDGLEYYNSVEEVIDGRVKDITTIWCLFVSREVYNLEWDWEEKKWVKE